MDPLTAKGAPAGQFLEKSLVFSIVSGGKQVEFSSMPNEFNNDCECIWHDKTADGEKLASPTSNAGPLLLTHFGYCGIHWRFTFGHSSCMACWAVGVM